MGRQRPKQPREKFQAGHQSYAADISGGAGRADPPIAGVTGNKLLEEAVDLGAVMPLHALGDHQMLDTHRLKERVRSLTADSISLGQQLAREKKQNKLNESQLSKFRNEIADLQEENRKLLEDKQSLELEGIRVDQLNRSVTSEHTSLNSQLQQSKQQIRDLQTAHHTKVSELSEDLGRMQSERDAVRAKLVALNQSHAQLSSQFDRLAKSLPAHVTMEEHQEVLGTIEGLVEDLTEQSEMKLRSKETELRLQSKEKKSLVLKLTDANAVIVKLEEENTQLYESSKRARESVYELQQELECSRDREVVVHKQLASTVMQAEKAIAEKNSFAKIAKVQRKSAARAVATEVEHNLTISALENRLQTYEDQLHQLDRASSVSKKDHSHQRKQYAGEIKHLRSSLAKKQRQVELLAQEKREAEERLDFVWRASMSGSPNNDPLLTSSLYGGGNAGGNGGGNRQQQRSRTQSASPSMPAARHSSNLQQLLRAQQQRAASGAFTKSFALS